MNFGPHVTKLKSKINQRTGLLWRVRNSIPISLAKDLYTSLIEPHFIYCNSIYDACSVEMKRQLQLSPNRALKAVLKTHNRCPSNSLHGESGVAWLETTRAMSCCIEIYKLVNNIGPSNLCTEINPTVSDRILRSNAKVKLNMHCPRTKLGEGNLLYQDVKYWDMLDADIQHSKSLAIFKRRLKSNNTFSSGHFTERNCHYLVDLPCSLLQR